jgi:molecular chaperone IbpA
LSASRELTKTTQNLRSREANNEFNLNIYGSKAAHAEHKLEIIMNRIDLTPLYRNSVGYDRFGSLLDAAFQTEKATSGYPPYNIEVVEENNYAITVAVAGFKEAEIELQVENGVLTVRGKKEASNSEKSYLHQGIATRSFERKFNLADHIEVVGANMADGLLTVQLVKEIPEAMKPRTIAINGSTTNVIQHKEKAA